MVASLPKTKVNAFTVTRFARENSLNEKFKGTWVQEGLPDEITKGILARTLKQTDFVDEIVRADHRADDWLDEMKKTENFAWVFKDPPLELGRYYNQFCNRNEQAYNDYKAMGIKKLANTEIERQDRK